VTHTLGIGFLGGTDMETVIRNIRLAEEYGFESAWIAEDYFFGGAFATAATCASQTSKIQIGIGVVNPFTRHPVLTGMEAAALDIATKGRLILGMGTSNAVWMEQKMGIPFEKPMTALRESVEIIQQLTRGQTVNYAGKSFNVNNVHLEFAPYRSKIPVYLGVKGPQALRMAGQYADGVLMSIMSSVEYVHYAVEHIQEGRAKSGRDMDGFDVAAYVIFSVDSDRQKARDRVKPMIAKYLGLHGDHPILTTTGLTTEEIAPFRQAFLEGRVAESLVVEKYVDLFAIAGTPGECREQLAKLRAAGVTHPIAFEVLGVPMEETMRSIVEHLT
jgi:5,10-methylenetetrahydromethanopterin reductase